LIAHPFRCRSRWTGTAHWIGGEFVFDWWLSDSLLSGHVERIDDIDE